MTRIRAWWALLQALGAYLLLCLLDRRRGDECADRSVIGFRCRDCGQMDCPERR